MLSLRRLTVTSVFFTFCLCLDDESTENRFVKVGIQSLILRHRSLLSIQRVLWKPNPLTTLASDSKTVARFGVYFSLK